MTGQDTLVIVGAGLAGAKAGEALREQGFDGRVVLIGAETERPYNRPPLSKDYLQGRSEKEKIYVHPRSGTPSTRSTCASALGSPASTVPPTRSIEGGEPLDHHAVAAQLQREGADSFGRSWQSLLASIASRHEELTTTTS